jgi:hypothetical protein
MYKHPLPFILALLFTLSAKAQRPPYRRLYADPNRPGMLMDSARLRFLKVREAYESRELARIRDSIRSLQTSAKARSTSLSKGLSTIPSILLSNSCGVNASFTPANDTTLNTGQDITFTNTSLNADSYEWIVDVYNHYYTTDYQFVPSVGVTQVLLVAHQGTCTDTAITYVVRNGTAPTDEKRMNISYGLPNTEEWVSGIQRAGNYIWIANFTDRNGKKQKLSGSVLLIR